MKDFFATPILGGLLLGTFLGGAMIYGISHFAGDGSGLPHLTYRGACAVSLFVSYASSGKDATEEPLVPAIVKSTLEFLLKCTILGGGIVLTHTILKLFGV